MLIKAEFGMLDTLRGGIDTESQGVQEHVEAWWRQAQATRAQWDDQGGDLFEQLSAAVNRTSVSYHTMADALARAVAQTGMEYAQAVASTVRTMGNIA